MLQTAATLVELLMIFNYFSECEIFVQILRLGSITCGIHTVDIWRQKIENGLFHDLINLLKGDPYKEHNKKK
jgi:hypothetical protein